MEEAVIRVLPASEVPPEAEPRPSLRFEPKPLGFWGEADRERVMRHEQPPLLPPDREEAVTPEPSVASETPRVSNAPEPDPALYGEAGLPWDAVPDAPASPTLHEAVRPLVSSPPAASRPAKASEPEQPVIEQLGEGQVRVGPYVYMGQVGGTYLLLRDLRNNREHGSLLILDQHAAHERVLVSRIEAGGFSGMSQPLVLPLEYTLHPAERERIQEFRDSLASLGFDLVLRDQGAGTVLEVRTVPPLLERAAAGEFIREVLAGRKEDLHSLWATMACKAAIKAGDVLASDEAVNLIAQWLMTENRQFCPHGRLRPPVGHRRSGQDVQEDGVNEDWRRRLSGESFPLSPNPHSPSKDFHEFHAGPHDRAVPVRRTSPTARGKRRKRRLIHHVSNLQWLRRIAFRRSLPGKPSTGIR